MNTVNASHFSRMCKVSREAIRKAIEFDRVKTIEVGGKPVVDLDHRVTQEYLRSKNPDYKAGAPTEPAPKKTAPKPAPKKKVNPKLNKPKSDPIQEITAPKVPDDTPPDMGIKSIDDVDKNNIGHVEKTDLQKLKLVAETRLKDIQVQEKEGELISRDLIKKVFSKIYTVDTEQLRTLEERLAPTICEIFKVGEDSEEGVKLRKEINDEISKVLKHIKMIIDNFLESIDPGKAK